MDLRNGQDILMFNTDYPHPEGGKDPLVLRAELRCSRCKLRRVGPLHSKNYQDYLVIRWMMPIGRFVLILCEYCGRGYVGVCPRKFLMPPRMNETVWSIWASLSPPTRL